jgi:hypothetical protein
MIIDMCLALTDFNATLRDTGGASGCLCADGCLFNIVGGTGISPSTRWLSKSL